MVFQPSIIHPQEFIIQPIDKVESYFDEDIQEPIKTLARSAQVAISGQISYNFRDKTEEIERGQGSGDRGAFIVRSKGYIVLLITDMTTLGYTSNQGDKLVSINGEVVNYYLNPLRPAGHYQDGPTLMKISFEDRRPWEA